MRFPWKSAAATFLTAIVVAVVVRVLVVADDCEESHQRMARMPVMEITLLDKFGKLKTLEAHIADQHDTRAAGYQHICEKLIRDTAILFVYSREGRGQFHMNNVQAPLDIGFFDSEGRLKKVLLMKPYTANERPLYDPGVPFQYALEAREGYFSDSGLTEGRSRLVVQSIKGRG